MPSAKQIKARKAFVRKFAKKGKRKVKSKKRKSTAVGSDFRPITTQTKKEAVRKQIGELKRSGTWNDQWDKRMQEFLNKENEETNPHNEKKEKKSWNE